MAAYSIGEIRRPAMKMDNPIMESVAATAERDRDSLKRTIRSGDELSEQTGEEVVSSQKSVVGEVAERIEGLIGRYPWPTLLLGMGLGYVLARRRR